MSSSHRVVHLSDLHLTGSGRDEDGVDGNRSLELVLQSLALVGDVDVVVVSGDVADDGSVAGCRAARDSVGAWAADRGATCVFTTGNHDRRDAFREVLGSGHRDAAGADTGTPGPPGTCAAVSHTNGLRVVSLDSLVVGAPHGELGADQLTWLRDVLAAPAPAGTVVALHHPPVELHDHPLAATVLHGPGRLAEVLAGSDVRAVLAGHLHHQLSSTLAGVPVWVTPGVITRADTTAARGVVRGVLGGSATVVDLGPDLPAVFTTLAARDPRAGELVNARDLVTGAVATTEP